MRWSCRRGWRNGSSEYRRNRGALSWRFYRFLGIVVAVIRMFVSTKSASPSAWFFLIVGGLSFIRTALLWEAQTLLAQTICADRAGDRIPASQFLALSSEI